MTTNFTGDGGDEFWSTVLNWDNGIPSIINAAVLDASVGGSPNKANTCDIAALLSVDQSGTYTGITTLSTAVVIEGALLINGAALSSFVTANNNLDIKGNCNASGATLGLIHNAGAVIRFGADVHLDEGDVDSQIEYFDFVGGGVVIHDTLIAMGSTQIPTIFIVRTNNEMSVSSNSTIINIDFETGATITDSGGGAVSLGVRGVMTLVDIDDTISATSPGNLLFQFNSLDAPGANYNGANFQVTSSLIIIQGDVTGINEAIIARTFTTANATLDLNGFSFSALSARLGAVAGDTINGEVLIRSGSAWLIAGSCIVGPTDGVRLSALTFEVGALASSIGGALTVGAGADFLMPSGVTLTVLGDYIPDTLADCDLLLGSILNLGGDVLIPGTTTTQDYDGVINAGIGGAIFTFTNSNNSARMDVFTLADGCVMTATGNCYTDTFEGPVSGNATIKGDNQLLISVAINNADNLTVASDIDGTTEFTFGFNNLVSEDYGNALIQFTDNAQNTITGTTDFHCWKLMVSESSQNTNVPIQIIGNINATIDNIIEIGDNSAPGTRGGIFTWDATGTLTMGGITIRDNNAVQVTQWVIGALGGTVNIGALGLVTETLADMDFSASSATINCAGAASVHATMTADFGATAFIHSGDLGNPTAGNDFFNLTSATGVSNTLTQTAAIRSSGHRKFTGTGTWDWNGFGATLTVVSLTTNIQYEGATNITFTDEGVGTMEFNIDGVGVPNVMLMSPGTFNIKLNVGDGVGVGDVEWKLTGNNSYGNTHSIFFAGQDGTNDLTVNLDGFSIIGAFYNLGFTASVIIALGDGGALIGTTIRYNGTNNAITGTGTINTAGAFDHDLGSVITTNVQFVIGDYDPVAGIVFNITNGSVEITGDFNSANLAFALTWATTVLKFTGSGTSTYNLGAGNTGPSKIMASMSGGTLEINDDQTTNTDIVFDATNGSFSLQLIGGQTYNFNEPSSFGTIGNKITMFSSTAPTRYIMNFNAPAALLRFMGIADSDFANVIQPVDTTTGSDDGNNILAGANGLLFAAVAFGTTNVVTFQDSRPDRLKDAVDTFMLTNSDGNIFTKAVLQVQTDNSLGRLLILTLFYTTEGSVLANPFVFNYLEDPVLSSIESDFEAFVVANPVSANFYGNLFVDRTDRARNAAIFSYVWITNQDEVDAPANWIAANDIT